MFSEQNKLQAISIVIFTHEEQHSLFTYMAYKFIL